MIRHTVSFSLKHPQGSPEEKAFLDSTLILKEIPGVLQFERLIQIGSKNKFHFGLSMEFLNQEAYDAYNVHPLHTAFIQQHWIPEVEDFLETDYIKYV